MPVSQSDGNRDAHGLIREVLFQNFAESGREDLYGNIRRRRQGNGDKKRSISIIRVGIKHGLGYAQIGGGTGGGRGGCHRNRGSRYRQPAELRRLAVVAAGPRYAEAIGSAGARPEIGRHRVGHAGGRRQGRGNVEGRCGPGKSCSGDGYPIGR